MHATEAQKKASRKWQRSAKGKVWLSAYNKARESKAQSRALTHRSIDRNSSTKESHAKHTGV